MYFKQRINKYAGIVNMSAVCFRLFIQKRFVNFISRFMGYM